MPHSRVVNRVVSIESSSRSPDFFNRLMSLVFSVLDFPIVVHAAQSSRQSSRHNRVVAVESSGHRGHYWNPPCSCMPIGRVVAVESSSRRVVARFVIRKQSSERTADTSACRRLQRQRLYLVELLLRRAAHNASPVPLGTPHSCCCSVPRPLLQYCMRASRRSPLRSMVAVRALPSRVSSSMRVVRPRRACARIHLSPVLAGRLRQTEAPSGRP